MSRQFNKEEAKIKLQTIVDRYSENHNHYISSNYNESECRLEFIDKLLEYFGWDVQNNSGKKPQYKEKTRKFKFLLIRLWGIDFSVE